MPLYMDRHDLSAVNEEELAAAHDRDEDETVGGDRDGRCRQSLWPSPATSHAIAPVASLRPSCARRRG